MTVLIFPTHLNSWFSSQLCFLWGVWIIRLSLNPNVVQFTKSVRPSFVQIVKSPPMIRHRSWKPMYNCCDCAKGYTTSILPKEDRNSSIDTQASGAAWEWCMNTVVTFVQSIQWWSELEQVLSLIRLNDSFTWLFCAGSKAKIAANNLTHGYIPRRRSH